MHVGILVLDKYFPERRREFFDNFEYFGLHVILDVLKREFGIDAEATTIDYADEYDCLLVSLTSINDVCNLVYTFGRRGLVADDLKPTIVIGGPAVHNIKTYYYLGDIFVFGRGEEAIKEVVEYISEGKPPRSRGIFIQGVHSFEDRFEILNVDQPYPYEVRGMRENGIGCRFRCRFCLYSWSRNYIRPVSFEGVEYMSGCEKTFADLEIHDGGYYVSAIDGYSERLRRAFRKPVTEELIRRKFKEFSEADTGGKRISLKLYQICGMPTETAEDRAEFFELMKRVDAEISPSNIWIFIFNTPFSAEPLTPAQRCEMDMETNWRKTFRKEFPPTDEGYFWRGENIRLYFYNRIPSTYRLFLRALINRGEEEDGKLLRYLVCNKRFNRLKHYQRMNVLRREGYLTKFGRRYDIDEPMATDFLISKEGCREEEKKLFQDLYGSAS
jgi:radical SAM superfamily enzyme YgiQ (UPF0313 family)